jgi:hypothetical protein
MTSHELRAVKLIDINNSSLIFRFRDIQARTSVVGAHLLGGHVIVVDMMLGLARVHLRSGYLPWPSRPVDNDHGNVAV